MQKLIKMSISQPTSSKWNSLLVLGSDPTLSMDLEQVDVKHLLEEDPREEQGESIDGKKNKEGFDEALNLAEAHWDDE